LTPTEFVTSTLFVSKVFRWEEVEEFNVMNVKGASMVVFALSPQGKINRPESWWRRLNKAFSGGDENLPDTYGMKAQALADLMNQRRRRVAGSA
jgi:hypothetical protein